MSFMQKIRGNRRFYRLPVILVIIALSLSMVGFFVLKPDASSNVSQKEKNNENDPVLLLQAEVNRLKSSLQSQPTNVDLMVELGEAQRNLGNYYLQQGNNEEAQGLLEESIANLKKALGAKPEDSSLWSNLGYGELNLAVLYLNQQKENEGQELIKKSLDSLQKAFNLNPDDIVLANNLAYVALNAGEPKLAEEAYQKILKQDFTKLDTQNQKYYIDTLINYAVFQNIQDNNSQKAKETLQKALSLGPDDNQKAEIESYLDSLNKGEEQ